MTFRPRLLTVFHVTKTGYCSASDFLFRWPNEKKLDREDEEEAVVTEDP